MIDLTSHLLAEIAADMPLGEGLLQVNRGYECIRAGN
jgi:hypothetical protein